MLVMPGRVTLLGSSRWAGQGRRYRTVQRGFSQALPWAMLCWVFFRQPVHRPDAVYLLAGDDVGVTQAGPHTDGLDRFCSSLSGKPSPGIAFLACSRVSVHARRAFPVGVEPVVRSAAEKAASQAKAAAKQQKPATPARRPGPPKGSRSTLHAAVPLPPEWSRLTARLDAFLKLSAGVIPLTSGVLDGHFGHHHALPRARQTPLHLIAKLRCAAALYVPDAGPSAGRGPRRQYGRKVDDGNLPAKYLTETTVEECIQTRVYQAPRRHKAFAHPLNGVLITTRHLRTQAQAHVIRFRRALTLASAPRVDDYRVRVPIELNCRDAHQHWGLEDFMHMTPTGGTHAANRAWFMVHVVSHLQAEVR